MTRFEYRVDKSVEGVLPVLKNIEKIIPTNPLIGFCGGTSIAPIIDGLKNLLQNPTSVFVGADALMIDERVVPENDPDSNIGVIRKHLGEELRKINLIPFNTIDTVKGVKDYEKMLHDHNGVFDLIFLGVGEDAHVAGLFPGLISDKLTPKDHENRKSFFTFDNSPKPPLKRMTAHPSLISSAKNTVLLFFGDAKKTAYNRYIAANESPDECPVLLVGLHNINAEAASSYQSNIYLLRDF